MPEDEVTPEPIPEPEPTTEEETLTLEQIGEQLLARMDSIDERIGQLEQRLSGYSTSDHTHAPSEPPTPTDRREDEQPRADRFWFRRIGE